MAACPCTSSHPARWTLSRLISSVVFGQARAQTIGRPKLAPAGARVCHKGGAQLLIAALDASTGAAIVIGRAHWSTSSCSTTTSKARWAYAFWCRTGSLCTNRQPQCAAQELQPARSSCRGIPESKRWQQADFARSRGIASQEAAAPQHCGRGLQQWHPAA